MDGKTSGCGWAPEDRHNGVPLQLSPEAMRSLGYGVVDAIVEHLETLQDQPPARVADRATMEARLREPPPEHGSDPAAVLARVRHDVLVEGFRVDHPRFLAYVPCPGNFVGAMGDALASGFNVFAGIWAAAPGAAQLELIVVDWLRTWCGLPTGSGGLFLSGSSMANLAGLAVARHARFGGDSDAARRGTVYYSDQAHSSISRALRILGVSADRVRQLPSDRNFRLVPETLAGAVNADRDAGLEPFCVISTAGTTNTGAVDPLPAVADLCVDEGLWLHVDGAFGAAAALCEDGRTALAGLERADSLALDAHKWLFQPIECGCLLVRDIRCLDALFRESPSYLRDTDRFGLDGEVNFSDLGPQVTRSFRALKLWMTLQVFGLAAFRAAVARGIALSELAERRLQAEPSWAVVTPAQLGVVTFRYVPPPGRSEEQIDALNSRIAQASVEGGFAVVSTTKLDGRTVLRLCTTTPWTTDGDIDETVRRLGEYGAALAEPTDVNGC